MRALHPASLCTWACPAWLLNSYHLLSHSLSQLLPNRCPCPAALPAFLCRVGGSEGELRRLRAEVAAKAAEVQEARQAEAEYAEECGRLGRDLAAERLRAKVGHGRGDGCWAAAKPEPLSTG